MHKARKVWRLDEVGMASRTVRLVAEVMANMEGIKFVMEIADVP